MGPAHLDSQSDEYVNKDEVLDMDAEAAKLQNTQLDLPVAPEPSVKAGSRAAPDGRGGKDGFHNHGRLPEIIEEKVESPKSS